MATSPPTRTPTRTHTHTLTCITRLRRRGGFLAQRLALKSPRGVRGCHTCDPTACPHREQQAPTHTEPVTQLPTRCRLWVAAPQAALRVFRPAHPGSSRTRTPATSSLSGVKRFSRPRLGLLE
eukprot:Rmarinus@m.7776